MRGDQQEDELNDFDELLQKRRNELDDERDDRGSFEDLDALISTSEACKRGWVRVEAGNAVRRIYVREKEVCRFHYEGAHIALVVPDRIGGIGMRMTANPEDVLSFIANLVADALQEAGQRRRI